MYCRACENFPLTPILSLGKMPLANAFIKLEALEQIEPTYPLDLMLCEQCSLVQLKNIVPPQILFDQYLYFSSNSDTMLISCAHLVERLLPNLPENATIIEIASNDGYLLKNYPSTFNVLGIEPAKNIADYASSQGIPTINEYFSSSLAGRLVTEKKQADIIHANNVMAHIPDIQDFAAGIQVLLKPTGTAIIEVPYLLKMIEDCEFDTIYHEHVFYFSLTALTKLFSRHKLVISDIELISIHGGSIRLFIKHFPHDMSNTVQSLLHKEQALGLRNINFYSAFSQRILQLKNDLLTTLHHLKNSGQRIAAYGASAKGTTLMNFFGLNNTLIDFVVDRSPHKQGYFTPGTQLEIKPLAALLQEKIDYALLLVWNFAEEILLQQQPFRHGGGKFIIPIPTLQIV